MAAAAKETKKKFQIMTKTAGHSLSGRDAKAETQDFELMMKQSGCFYCKNAHYFDVKRPPFKATFLILKKYKWSKL